MALELKGCGMYHQHTEAVDCVVTIRLRSASVAGTYLDRKARKYLITSDGCSKECGTRYTSINNICNIDRVHSLMLHLRDIIMDITIK